MMVRRLVAGGRHVGDVEERMHNFVRLSTKANVC